MHKIISFSFFLVVVPHLVLAQVVTDRQLEGLKGDVKTLNVDGAVLDGQPGNWKELRRGRAYTISWDKQGHEIERIISAADYPLTKIVSTYNADQKTQTEKHYDLYKSNSQGVKGFVLDPKGKPIKPPPPPPQILSNDGAVTKEITYKSDENGNRSEKLIYEGEGRGLKLTQRRVYVWDTSGKLKEEIRYDGQGNQQFKFVYKYDPQGNEAESVMIEGKNKITSRTTYSDYKFDSQGNWISRINHEDYLNSVDMRIKKTSITYRQITYWE
jgi:hypothetical protein